MPIAISSLAADVVPFLAMEVMERGFALARAGVDVVQLGVGEPGFAPPPEVIAATQAALAAGDTHYTNSRGTPDLREAIAAECAQRRGVAVTPDQVLVTSGTSPALLLVFQTLLDPGDEVLVPTPHYACYPNIIRVAGGVPIFIPTSAEDGYTLDVAKVRAAITPRTKAIIVASPANPTGSVQPPAVIDALCDLPMTIVSDEIYDGLLYDGAVVRSPLGRAENAIVLDGFSKRYAMTGFRLGYAIVPEELVRPMQSLLQNLFISTSAFVQRAGIAALEHGEAHRTMMHGHYRQRRDLLVAGLRELGLGIAVPPRGAFYVLADARRFGADSLKLAFDILERAHVASGPGRDFGQAAEGYLRFSFCAGEDAIHEGLRRLGQLLPTLT